MRASVCLWCLLISQCRSLAPAASTHPAPKLKHLLLHFLARLFPTGGFSGLPLPKPSSVARFVSACKVSVCCVCVCVSLRCRFHISPPPQFFSVCPRVTLWISSALSVAGTTLPLLHSLSSLFLPKDKHTFSLTAPVPPGTVFYLSTSAGSTRPTVDPDWNCAKPQCLLLLEQLYWSLCNQLLICFLCPLFSIVPVKHQPINKKWRPLRRRCRRWSSRRTMPSTELRLPSRRLAMPTSSLRRYVLKFSFPGE